MKQYLILAGLSALISYPAVACDTYDEVVADGTAHGVVVSPMPPDALAAANAQYQVKASRGFLASGVFGLEVGLEVNGCLLPPILLSGPASASAQPGA